MGTEVNLDSYQTALEEVLSWLLSAEDTLQAQGEISSDVEEVKEQFHTHEVKQNIDLGDKARASSSRQVSLSQSLPKILVFLWFSFGFFVSFDVISYWFQAYSLLVRQSCTLLGNLVFLWGWKHPNGLGLGTPTASFWSSNLASTTCRCWEVAVQRLPQEYESPAPVPWVKVTLSCNLHSRLPVWYHCSGRTLVPRWHPSWPFSASLSCFLLLQLPRRSPLGHLP